MTLKSSVLLVAAVLALIASSRAFMMPRPSPVQTHDITASNFYLSSTAPLSSQALFIFKKPKKDEEDLSFIETRDMTREEMLQLNKENESVMNAELIGMTVFSLILSIPMLYLVWVGFFADTAGVEEL